MDTYRPTTHPGARFPHFWLTDVLGATRLSTIDLLGSEFVLFTMSGPINEWRGAASRVAAEFGVPVVVHDLGVGSDLKPIDFGDLVLLGIKPDGALLVRPDSHVGFRATTAPADPAAELKAALATILRRA